MSGQMELGCDRCRGLTPPVGARCRSCGRTGASVPLGHHCHARGCTIAVKPEMLMCKRHWFMVPLRIRDAVWAAYRPGQCDDKKPSPEWHKAADAAIGYVARREGQPVRQCELEALEAFA